jgi:integrase
MKLTAAAIATAQPGAILRDDVVVGLHLRVFPNRKVWYLYYRTRDGKERRPKLGDLGVLSLTQARAQAKDILAGVTLGADPSADNQAARRAPTVADLAERWMAEVGDKAKTGRELRRMVEKDVIPALGSLRVAEVDHEQVAALHTKLTKRGPIMANRVVEIVSTMFTCAERWKMRPTGSNPCQHVAMNPERKRKRHLKADEFPKLAALLDAKAARAPRAVAFVWLLLFSGARPMEIATARREWLERRETPAGVLGILHLPNSKEGARDVFLPPQAMAVIDRLPPSRDGTITGLKRQPRDLWRRWRAEIGLDDLWVRDMRRSFATVGLRAGHSLGVIGELLGHNSTQTTAIYAKLMDDAAQDAVVETAAVIERLLKVQS